ncbi:hypothetical protein [Neisseria dumasiana]|uniref:Uncharacterized protein n=1 Tax=Neisseria dumasiana TaxID=1931275 RepID=A0A1X3DLS9_9NEIS|nr:hypothetical protein [Neisseria dumasiana]OSI24647.1 hypothetical protein BV912_01990 [Neisseria dumasiana]
MNIHEIAIKSLLSAIDARGWNILVHEDNGGGLTLAIWRGKGRKPGMTWFCHCGYEYNHGQLVEDLVALAEGSNPASWEGMNDMARNEFWEMVNEQYSGHCVLDMDGCQPWGAASRTELGIFCQPEED